MKMMQHHMNTINSFDIFEINIHVNLILFQAFAAVSFIILLLSIVTFCASTHPDIFFKMDLDAAAEFFRVDKHDLVQAWSNEEWFEGRFGTEEYPDSARRKRDTTADRASYNVQASQSGIYQRSPTNSNDSTIFSKELKNEYLYEISELKKQGTMPGIIKYFLKRRKRSLANNTDSNATIIKSNDTHSNYINPNISKFPMDILEEIHMDPVIMYIDNVCFAAILLELILRLIFCPSKKRFFYSIINIIDIVSVIGFAFEELFLLDSHTLLGSDLFLNFLYVLIMLRIFRLFRWTKQHKVGNSINLKYLF